jgi:hypothetical protein
MPAGHGICRSQPRPNFKIRKAKFENAKTETLFYAVDHDDAFLIVNFAQADFDNFGVAGLDDAAYILGLNGHFAVAAVDQDAERNAARTAKVKKAVHGGADGTAGVEHIVNQDQIHAVDGEGDIGRLQDGLRRDFGKIVAVKRDIKGADGNFDAVNAAHGLSDALGKGDAAAADTDQGEMLGAAAFFNDFMGNALQSAVNFRGGHQLPFFDDFHLRGILAQANGLRARPEARHLKATRRARLHAEIAEKLVTL